MPHQFKKRKHRILIDAHKFGSIGPIDGSKRYVNSLLNALYNELTEKFDIFLFFEKKIVLLEDTMNENQTRASEPSILFDKIRMRINRYFEQFYLIRKTVFLTKSFLFRRKISRDKFDIVHILLPHRYYFIKDFFPNTVQVMSILDLTCRIVPHFHLDANIKSTWSGIVYSSQYCDSIICISYNTKKDFLNYFPNYTGEVAVTHLGFDDKIFFQESNVYRIEEVKKKYGITSKRYVLSLFTLEPRKNLKNVILAFELLRGKSNCNQIELIVAGKVGWKMDEDLKFIKNATGVRLIGYVDDPDLAPLYSGATAFCYPSFYEGFGLPLIEAMACGTPVVFGNNSSMPEIVGGAGLTCNPDSPEDIMIQLERICTSTDLGSYLSQKSIKRARDFSWTKCAKETLNLYERMIHNKRNGC